MCGEGILRPGGAAAPLPLPLGRGMGSPPGLTSDRLLTTREVAAFLGRTIADG